MPADRRRIEEHLRAKERRNACGLRIPLVPADEDADGGITRFPDLESVGFTGALAVVIKMAIAGREVILFVIEGIVRNVHLAVDAEKRPVRIDDGGGIPVDARRLPLEEREDDHHLKLPRDRLHALGCGPRNRLRQVKPIAFLRLAEVLRIEELFQTDDLCPATGGVAHEPFGPRDVRRDIGGGVILDEAYGEGGVRRVPTTVYGRNRCPCAAARPGRPTCRMFPGSSPCLALLLPSPRAAMAMCICCRMPRVTWWMA